jgi:hypothetical protein
LRRSKPECTAHIEGKPGTMALGKELKAKAKGASL